MTYIQKDWWKDPCKPWRGVRRDISIEFTLPLGGWSHVLETINSTPLEDMSKRAFFPKVTLACSYCDKVFVKTVADAKKSHAKTGGPIYCSLSCSTTAMNIRVGNVGPFCTVCGKKIKKADGRNCSAECKAESHRLGGLKARVERKMISCEICQKPMSVPTTSKRRFCSTVCSSTHHRSVISGKNNPVWQGGVDALRLRHAGSQRAWIRLRTKIVDRDLGKCVVCASQKKLHVHHIDVNNTNNTPSNLVTLCAKCHFAWHGAERSKPQKILWPWLKTYAVKATHTTFR